MVAKKTNFDMKTILIIAIIALVAIGIVYVILTPSEGSDEDALTVDTIEKLRLNKDYYEGKTIKITGIYRIKDGNRDALSPPTTDADPTSEDYIILDLYTNNINLTETPAVEGDKYKVRGKVEIVTPDGSASSIGYVQLVAESFVKV